MRKVLVPLMLCAALGATTLPGTLAGAGDGPPDDDYLLDVTLLSNVEPLRFGLMIDPGEVTCVEGSFVVDSVEIYDYDTDELVTEVTPLSVTEDPSDPNSAEMVLPANTPGGVLYVTAHCDDSVDVGVEADFDVDGVLLFASMGVTKTVVGPVPADAAFVVRLDCSDAEADSASVAWGGAGAAEVGDTFVVDLPFGVAGGTKYVYMDEGGLCLVTEPVTGGADSVSVSNDIDTGPAPAPYTSTVTNTFAAAVSPNFTG